jgi:hypothetical protein
MCKLRWLAALLMVTFLAPSAQAVHLRGKIVRVGFPGGGRETHTRGADHYRSGCWVPIRVELTNSDGDLFEGSLIASQPDRDGDEVLAPVQVAVRGTRYYYLYVPAANPGQQAPFTVRVVGASGGMIQLYDDADKPVRELVPSNELRPVMGSSQVILDISDRPLSVLGNLVTDPKLIRELYVTRVAAAELPEQCTGLDMADVIVWDAADPGAIDLPQREAVIEWVRRGGTLLMGVSRNWELVSKSQFGPLLPAQLHGTAAARQLDELSRAIMGGLTLDFEHPLTYCPITPGDLAPDATVIVPPEAKRDATVYVTRRPLGRGQLILVTAELHDLIAHGTTNEVFLRAILGIRKDAAQREEMYAPRRTDLFTDYVETKTGFRMTTGMYFLAAFLFVVAYIGASTGGTWAWLKRKGRIQYSWPAFAMFALVASVVGLGAVQLIRGISHQLQQLTVVDARAGSSEASAICYFGLKTAAHVQLDLRVPVDASKPDDSAEMVGGLTPLPPDTDSLGSHEYAAASRYEALAGIGELSAVPLRATLKQFQAAWRGQTAGEIRGHLARRDASSFRFKPESYVENRLGVDLKDCYLLVATRNVLGGTGERSPSRAMNIEAYPLGELGKDKRLAWGEYLQRMLLERERAKLQPGAEMPDLSSVPEWLPPQLREVQANDWLHALRVRVDDYGERRDPGAVGMQEFHSALLLITTFSELDTREYQQQGRSLQLSRGRDLDRSAEITTESALFVGFADGDAGPARLCWRPSGPGTTGWRALQPREASTMYRIAIPISPP